MYEFLCVNFINKYNYFYMACDICTSIKHVVNLNVSCHSYIQYSNIAARLLRRALKPEFRTEAARREESSIKFTPWKDGKPISKHICV